MENKGRESAIRMKKDGLNRSHDHSHSHHDDSDDNLTKLWTVSIVCLLFMIIEIIGGYMAQSIAIMSDAAHLLSDLLGFQISIASIYVSKRKANHQMSYGYHRAEVIGALVSINIIWGLTIWLVYEAAARIIHRSPVDGFIMLITACLGFIFNLIMGLILFREGIDHKLHKHDHGHDHGHDHDHSDHHSHSSHEDTQPLNTKGSKTSDLAIKNRKGSISPNNKLKKANTLEKLDTEEDSKHKRIPSSERSLPRLSHAGHGHGHSHGGKNVNVRAALIHVIGDLIQNVGVILAGLLIYYNPDWVIVDSICTFFFSIIVAVSTIKILEDCLSVLMEGAPIDVKIEKLLSELEQIEGVENVHDLHVWSLSMDKVSLSCHLISNNPSTLQKVIDFLKNEYNFTHCTIQVENENNVCRQELH